MILQSLAAYGPALAAGIGLIHLFWENNERWAILLKISLGIGAGLGITSCLYFLRLLLFPGQGGYLLIQAGFLGAVILALLIKNRLSPGKVFYRFSISPVQVILGLATLAVLWTSIYYTITFARVSPHGDYDAQAIWNLRARSIYRSGDTWENAFSPLINRNFHMDYPLLVPLSVVGGWNMLGSEVQRVPAVLSMLFLFGMAGIVFSVIAHLRTSSQAALAVIVLLATPSLLLFSTFQTADIPLTYFLIASTSLLILASNSNNRSLLFLSGIMAGLAAWTKNEGIPFLLVMIVCTLFISGVRQARTHLPFLLAGMALPLFTIVLFKIFVPANNDLFVNNGLSEIISKLLSPERYVQIMTHLLSELLQLGGWPVSIIIILFVYGWIMGIRSSGSPAEKFSGVIPLSQFVIYMLIYIITPYDLEWHINYSMSRLLIHIFPLALFSFFLFVNTPETVLNKSAPYSQVTELKVK
ncbi:MAG: hypothetical protein EHM33_02720 [Chloroflexi bacterium]|nr:MAG: hypothetical protein EHM33_02720 [Chloroflexota bacterium]